MSSKFKQAYIYCSVCHQRYTKEDPLHLTSCAHILCTKHINVTNVCPVCGTKDISVIKLLDSKPLPNDVKLFFEPIPDILEMLYNVTQFQMNGLVNQIEYYQNHCVKLREKVARQQQLLIQAKQELDLIPNMRKKINELENRIKGGDNRNGRSHTGTFFNSRSQIVKPKEPPPTVDLTLDDEFSQEQPFLTKVKLGNPNLTVAKSHIGKSITKHERSRDFTSSNDTVMAESTQIGNHFTYSPLSKPTGRVVTVSTLSSSGNDKLVSTDITTPDRNRTAIISSPRYGLVTPKSIYNRNSKMQFPTPLEKLTIIKRHNTVDETSKIDKKQKIQRSLPFLNRSSTSDNGETSRIKKQKSNISNQISRGSTKFRRIK